MRKEGFHAASLFQGGTAGVRKKDFHAASSCQEGRGAGGRKKVFLALAAASMLLCGGCASTELEQRNFPLAMGIDLQNEAEGGNGKLAVSFDFPDLAQVSEKGGQAGQPMGLALEGEDLYHVEKAYENNTNHLLDYNHLKAVVLGESVLADGERLRALLLAWEQKGASIRNTSLFIGSGSAAKILSLTQETEGSVGKYLEGMLESQKDFKQDKIVTVGDLMNQWHNQDELLLIPVLTEEGERPLVTKYAVLENFSYKGMVTAQDAMKAFLAQGLLRSFICEPGGGEVAEISHIKAKKEVVMEDGAPKVVVEIGGKGRLLAGQADSAAERLRLEQKIEGQLEEELRAAAERLREEYGADMADSYISLGRRSRELYRKYQGRPDAYDREQATRLRWTFRCKIGNDGLRAEIFGNAL